MPQPQAVTDAAEELIALYREAQTTLMDELGRALGEPSRWRQVRRLRELIGTNAEIVATLEAGTRGWLVGSLAEIHALGAAAALAEGATFAWSMPHIDAVQALATKAWEEIAPNLRHIDAAGRGALRTMARDAARGTLLEGRTAAQSGRLLERWAADRGFAEVTYRNGARHLIGDYADTVARTVAAEAYNNGTFTQLGADGVEWVEVFDGPDCGWTSHDDADKANGTVRRIDDAMSHSLSHPRCARSFGGRPDVTSAEQAAQARRFTDEEQARMAAEERARAASAPVTLSGRARAGRVARTPRAS